MTKLQSIKETEQRVFENKFGNNIIRQKFHIYSTGGYSKGHDKDYKSARDEVKEISEWLSAHDLRLETAIREDERERVVEMVEKQIKGLEFLIKQTAPSEEWKNIARAQINAHKDTLSSLQEKQ